MTRARDKANSTVTNFTSTGIDDNADANAITIDSSENVGIGKSTSIADRLHIEKSGANCLLSVARTSDGAAGRLVMQHTDSVGALQTTGSVPLTFGTADTERMRIDAAGRVTMPSQPAFQVYKSSNDQNNIAADNSSPVVTWSAEAFDIGSNFASNTFTAPVTGKYLLTAKLRVSDPDSASQYYILKLVASNGNAFDIFDSNEYSSDLDYLTLQVTIVHDMDANDTARVDITQQGGTSQSDIIGGRHYSNFSGYLLG